MVGRPHLFLQQRVGIYIQLHLAHGVVRPGWSGETHGKHPGRDGSASNEHYVDKITDWLVNDDVQGGPDCCRKWIIGLGGREHMCVQQHVTASIE